LLSVSDSIPTDAPLFIGVVKNST